MPPSPPVLTSLRAAFAVAVFLVAATARADAPAAALKGAGAPAGVAGRPARLSQDVLVTRYGTSHERLSVLTANTRAEVDLTPGLTGWLELPLAASVFDRSNCCRYSLGNVGGGIARRVLGDGGRGASVFGGLSLPTAQRRHDPGINARFAATAEVVRDPGLFLPGVTTARAGAFAWWALPGGIHAHARIAVHGWRTDGEITPRHQVLLPFEAGLRAALPGRLVAAASVASLHHPKASGETLLHALNAGLEFRGERLSVGARLQQPLDESLRALQMRGLGVHLAHVF
jgi:hypothetical protein